MKQTPNYNLPQFEGTDFFNKEALNDAFDKIDTGISDLQETINNASGNAGVTAQEVVEARGLEVSLKKRIDKIDEISKTNSASLEDMKEYLNYMPINGGDFDGNNNTHVSIDGGTY